MNILLHFAVSGEWGISTSWGLFFVPSLTSIGHISILCMIKKVSKKYLSYKIVIDSRILNSGTRRITTQEYSCVILESQLNSPIEDLVSRVPESTSTVSYLLYEVASKSSSREWLTSRGRPPGRGSAHFDVVGHPLASGRPREFAFHSISSHISCICIPLDPGFRCRPSNGYYFT